MKLPVFPRWLIPVMGLWLSLAITSAQAQDAQPTTVTQPTTATAATDNATTLTAEQAMALLLTDPATRDPRFKPLGERRDWLAMQDGSLANFQKVAGEFEAMDAYYSALEILFFAEKIATDPEQRQSLNVKMQSLIDKTKPAEDAVAEAVQLWDSGRRKTAVDKLTELATQFPMCEKTHYRLGEYYLTQFLDNSAKQPDITQDNRIQIFRLCYDRLEVALALDPLLYDAYYQLNILRSTLPDVPVFLKKTEVFSQRALDFMNDTVPAISKLEEGDRNPEALVKAGEALEEVAIWPYAVYAYQAAISQATARHAADDVELTGDLTGRIERIRTDHIAKKKD